MVACVHERDESTPVKGSKAARALWSSNMEVTSQLDEVAFCSSKRASELENLSCNDMIKMLFTCRIERNNEARSIALKIENIEGTKFQGVHCDRRARLF